jgi:hypothetical protein
MAFAWLHLLGSFLQRLLAAFIAWIISEREATMFGNRRFHGTLVSACILFDFTAVDAARAPAWKTIKPEIGGHSFQMPIAPKPYHASIGDKSKPGEVVYGIEIPGGAIFVRSEPVRTKGADATIAQELDAARDDYVKKMKCKLAGEKEITLDGYTGRQLNIEGPSDFNSQVRIFILEDCEIRVSALWKGKEMTPDMARFLKSLKLPKKQSG